MQIGQKTCKSEDPYPVFPSTLEAEPSANPQNNSPQYLSLPTRPNILPKLKQQKRPFGYGPSYLNYYLTKTNQVPPLYLAIIKVLLFLPKTFNFTQRLSILQFNTILSENNKAQEPLICSTSLQKGKWRTA